MDAPELITPNWHVVLIHGPLALLVAGALIEFFGQWFWPRSTFRTAGHWMILLGCLASIPAALVGVYAMADVVRMSLPADQQDGPWREMIAASPIGPGSQAWEMMTRHAWLNLMATGLFALVAVVGLGSRDPRRVAVRLPLMLMLLLGLGIVLTGAWYGGEMVYRQGVGVIAQTTTAPQPTPSEPPPAEPEPATQPLPTVTLAGLVAQADVPATASPQEAQTAPAVEEPQSEPMAQEQPAQQPAADQQANGDQSAAAKEQADWKRGLAFMLPPLQVHIVLGGTAIAIGLAAIGLSLRASNVAVERYYRRETQPLSTMAGAFGARPASPDPYDMEPPIDDGPRAPALFAPASRFWLLASLVAVLAATAGVIVFVSGQEGTWPWDWRAMWDQNILDPEEPQITRRFAHIVAGGAIILVPLLMAVASRLMTRHKWLILLLSLLLLLAVAAQVWLGLLLTWDQPVGPLTAFQ